MAAPPQSAGAMVSNGSRSEPPRMTRARTEGHNGARAADVPDARPPVVLRPDTWKDYALGGALWAAGLGWLVPMMGLQMALYRVSDPRKLQWLERLYTRGQVALTGSRWRAVVDPAIDPSRPYAFFQNHVNHLDHCTLYCATPHFKQGIELEDHFRYPVYGAYMKGRGTIPVRRGDAGQLRQLVQRMREELSRGSSLLVFPEGTRTLDGHLGELQPGMFRLVQQLGVPIVPVTVTGMYRVMRKGSYLIRPGYDVTVYCDAPIETAGTSRRDAADLVDRVRSVMQGRLDAYWRETAANAGK
jgi:1-acyl-sn-glycerol-3-phosphate acyltransferase